MGSHDLEIKDVKRTVAAFDDIDADLTTMEVSLQTLGEVSDMDLAVGAVNHALRAMGTLIDEIKPAHARLNEMRDFINQQAQEFARQNESMNF